MKKENYKKIIEEIEENRQFRNDHNEENKQNIRQRSRISRTFNFILLLCFSCVRLFIFKIDFHLN